MTWNIWWRFGPWQERQPAIRAELERVNADVILLQEVFAVDGTDQAAELADHLGLFLARTTEADGSPQEFGNAILSRYPIDRHAMIRLAANDGSPSHRSALVAHVDGPAGRQPFAVTHLAWQYDASALRQTQLGAVVDFIAENSATEQAAAPAVVAGDFNAVPASDEIRRLTGVGVPYRPGLVFTDCWAAVGEGPGWTWTRDNPHAADALWPRRRLDYVFVAWPRPKPFANPQRAGLAGVEPIDGILPSDHYAVVVDFDERQTLDHG